MYQLILLIHVFAAVFIVALVLVQQGKGATMGAAFGSGASQTVFGSRGSGSFLFRLTIGLATLFFITSISLNYLTTRAMKQEKVMTLPVPETPVRTETNKPLLPLNETKQTLPTTDGAVPGNIPIRK